MALYGEEQGQFYLGQVPREFTADVARIVMSCYLDSAQTAEIRWGKAEERDALPILRRADIETALSMLPARFPGLAKVRKRPNTARTSTYTEVRCGAVVLTQSKTEGAKAPIRDALFRRSLARTSALNLWDRSTPPDNADTLWACVIHGPADSPSRPAYLRIAFPLPDGSFEYSLNLFDLIPEVVYYGVDGIEQVSTWLAKLRKDVRLREDEAE